MERADPLRRGRPARNVEQRRRAGNGAPVLGRKNYLFCGSDAGGQRAACVYTIVETAKMCGINPQAYLADVLDRIADHPIHQIDTLLPWLWTK